MICLALGISSAKAQVDFNNLDSNQDLTKLMKMESSPPQTSVGCAMTHWAVTRKYPKAYLGGMWIRCLETGLRGGGHAVPHVSKHHFHFRIAGRI